MKTFEQHKQQLKSEISELENEINMLESSGLDLKIDYDRWRNKYFVIDDYTKAEDYELKPSCGCCSDAPYYIHFIKNIETEYGKFKVHVRHEDWHTDNMRFAFNYDFDEDYTFKHVDNLIEFYRQKGVKQEILDRVKIDVKTLIENQMEIYEEDQ